MTIVRSDLYPSHVSSDLPLHSKTWLELFNHPELLKFARVRSRDHKAGAIIGLFLGGMTGRIVVDRLGSAAAFGICAGLRALGALGWALAV